MNSIFAIDTSSFFNQLQAFLMRITNLVFSIIFLLFAALQYNDPDPYIWIPIYSYAAVLCFLAFRGKYYPRAFFGGIVAFLIYAVFLFFTNNGVLDWAQKHEAESLVQTMKAEKPWVEDTREFGGLLILIIVFSINYIFSKKKGSSRVERA
ncbi:MAG: transmembrane 220 family protein [Chitinophagaceae bacterium]|nr:transmembrane 220 family protein [Chitinophagaceae bacterium]